MREKKFVTYTYDEILKKLIFCYGYWAIHLFIKNMINKFEFWKHTQNICIKLSILRRFITKICYKIIIKIDLICFIALCPQTRFE